MMETPDLFKKADLSMPFFADRTIQNGGFLPIMKGAHACWYYARCAHQMLEKVDEGSFIVGEDDHIERLNNLARSIALAYRLDDPDAFLIYMPLVRKEAERTELPWDSRIETPWKSKFITRWQ